MKRTILLTMMAAVLFVACKQAEKPAEAKRWEPKSGVLLGPVTAVDAAKNELTVGEGFLVSLGQEEMAGVKIGDEVRIFASKGKNSLEKIGVEKGPKPWVGTGVAMGPITSVDAKKCELVLGDHIIKVSAEDAAKYKAGDDVTVSVEKDRAVVSRN